MRDIDVDTLRHIAALRVRPRTYDDIYESAPQPPRRYAAADIYSSASRRRRHRLAAMPYEQRY